MYAVQTLSPVFLHEILRRIFSYLEQEDLRNARLVCSTWNETAIHQAPLTLKLDVGHLGLLCDLGQNVNKRMFQRLYFNAQRANDIGWDLALIFLTERNLNLSVLHLTLQYGLEETDNINSFVNAVNNGLFRNLKELLVRDVVPFINYFSTFEKDSLPCLKHLSLSPRQPALPQTRTFDLLCQTLIHASPNLTSIVLATGPLRLENLQNLKKLTFNSRRSLAWREENIVEMLEDVQTSLVSLTLRFVFLYHHTLPALPNLRELALDETELENTCIETSFPNLATMYTYSDFGCRPEVDRYLKGRPELLEFFGTEYSPVQKSNSVVFNYLPLLPNLVLFVLHLHLVPEQDSRKERKERMFFLNLNLPHIVVNIKSDCNLSTLLKYLQTARLRKGSKRLGSVLEFLFPRRVTSDECGLDEKDGLILKKFGRVMQKVARKWGFIKLTGFSLPVNWMQDICQDVNRMNLPVSLSLGVRYDNVLGGSSNVIIDPSGDDTKE